MKTFRASAFVKLIIALLVIALLTGCLYFGVFGVAYTVVGADDWAGAVLNLAMSRQTQQVYDYYYLTEEYGGLKEKDIPDWAKEQLAAYEAMFDPEVTNFRYQITDENGKVLFGNYDGEEYIARSYDWEQRFIGTDAERQQLNAFESGRMYDYENNVYLPELGYSRYPVEYWDELPEEYVQYDENGYLYNVNGEAVARLENYSEIFSHLTESEEGTMSAMTVDGVAYYPVDRNAADISEYAYYDDYGNFYDEDLNCIAHNGEYPMVTGTPAPGAETQIVTSTPKPTSDSDTKTDVQPIIVKLSAQMTAEEYEALYDKCYEEYSIRGYIPTEMPVDDAYHALYMRVLQYDLEKDDYLDSAIGLGICGLVLLLFLIVLAGKRNEEGLYEAAGLGRLPWDLWCIVIGCLAIGAGCVVYLAAEFTMESFHYGMGVDVAVDLDLLDLVIKGCVAAVAVCMAVVVGTLHSAAARVKVKGWWRNCLCGKAVVWCWGLCKKALKWCWKLWLRIWRWVKGMFRGLSGALRKIPLIWKAVVVLGVLWVIETVYAAAFVWNSWTVVGTLWNIVKFLVCIIICLMLKRLQQGARTIADGDLSYRIDTKNLFGDFKEHAECLNRIGDGLSHSVDAQLRSERMKTELITNVSHDLKTPLTSIVNYVDLLKKEQLEGTAAEYVEVLDRQSARLKKLTEDLVEASKASTGSLSVNVERVSVTELIEQARAEYAPRLNENGLQTIVRQPDEEVTVWADGKYVWRILDNLLSNVCKYAMPNTRVYLELRKDGDQAVLSVKNISRESLNISADELMERFVRGDSSRTTEGSGLGLSIAQSLANLMGGEVRIVVDGDLFKADVTLPLAK